MVTVRNLIQSFSFMAGNNHVVISYQKRQETIKRSIKSVYQKLRNRAFLWVHTCNNNNNNNNNNTTNNNNNKYDDTVHSRLLAWWSAVGDCWGCRNIYIYIHTHTHTHTHKRHWIQLHNEQLNDLYSSTKIIRVIKSIRMRWVGHVARMREMTGADGVLVGKPEGMRLLGRPRRR